jgi:uncharacterized protein (TIGR02453 family)
MATQRGVFGADLMKFLKELEAHNDRQWFESNKHRYESAVRGPALEFIRQMRPHVLKFSAYLTAIDRKVGGSLMRVYRDTRFAKDKSPYKTNLGIQFRHEDGRDVHAPGLYFHVDSQSVFLAVGMWHPDAESLQAMREAIDSDPRAWQRVRDATRFRDSFSLEGDSLKRPPRGFSADHPMLEDLKRKDHIAVRRLSKKDVTRPDLVRFVAGEYSRAQAYFGWQAKALGLSF